MDFELSDELKALNVSVGQTVEAGDPLAVIVS